MKYTFVQCNNFAAHIISQDFRQEYIKSLRKAIPSVPWIVLTHIASADVLNDIVEKFHLREPIAKFKKSSFRKNLYYDIIFKNTIVDLFAHLKQYVTSCLENGDGNVKKVKNILSIFINLLPRTNFLDKEIVRHNLLQRQRDRGTGYQEID